MEIFRQQVKEDGQYDIFKENEIKANRVAAIILLINVGLYVISWILFEVEYFYAYVSFRPLFLICILLLLLSNAVCFYFKLEPSWVKNVLIGTAIIVYAITIMIMTFSVLIFMVIPMVLSVRYFSKKYTRFIAIISIVIFFFAYLYGAYYGLTDLNMIQFEPGTVIEIIGDGWLDESILDIPYRRDVILYNAIMMYIIRLFPITIVAVACVKIAENGRRMMMEHARQARETTRVSTELSLATKIQSDMLPNIFPPFPDRDEFDLYASMDPAREVGGDFYDFFLVDDDHLALVMADVSGKGIPAAMFMMFCKNIIANNLMLGKSPAKTLTDTNATVCKNNSEEMFLTAWVGVLEISTGRLACANAGHEYPVLRRGGGAFEIYKDVHGMAIGWLDDTEYQEYELMLSSGDRLFQYTDGVTEAAAADGSMFGMERITEVFNAHPDASPEEMILHIKAAVDDFSKGAEQFDDITMLALSIQ